MSFLSETRAMIMNLKPAALSQHHLLSDLSSCSAFFGSLPWSSWPPCCSSNMLGMLLPWSFLTDWSLCIDCSDARYPQYRHSNLQGQYQLCNAVYLFLLAQSCSLQSQHSRAAFFLFVISFFIFNPAKYWNYICYSLTTHSCRKGNSTRQGSLFCLILDLKLLSMSSTKQGSHEYLLKINLGLKISRVI